MQTRLDPRPWLSRGASLAGTMLIAAVLIAPVLVSCSGGSSPDQSEAAAAENAAMTPAQMVERGAYLVTIAACNDCHTPFKMGEMGPEPDMTRMLSGHPQDFAALTEVPGPQGPWGWHGTLTNTAFAGPWGISFTANLTPDPETGLGSWTEEFFMASLRTGKHWGRGRDIMPPMPWPSYSKMTDEDMKAIFAYLKTIPPVKNSVPAWVPPPAPDQGE